LCVCALISYVRSTQCYLLYVHHRPQGVWVRTLRAGTVPCGKRGDKRCVWVHSSVFVVVCVPRSSPPLGTRPHAPLFGVSQPRREFPARSSVRTRRRVPLFLDGSWPRIAAEKPSLNWLFPLRARARTCHGWGVPRRLPAANLLALQSVEKSVLHGYMRPSERRRCYRGGLADVGILVFQSLTFRTFGRWRPCTPPAIPVVQLVASRYRVSLL